MKYYSEITKKLYDSKDELVKAEVAATKAKSDREVKAKEVTELIKAANEATKKANTALREFINEYGSFKTTIKSEDAGTKSDFWDLFDKLMF